MRKSDFWWNFDESAVLAQSFVSISLELPSSFLALKWGMLMNQEWKSFGLDIDGFHGLQEPWCCGWRRCGWLVKVWLLDSPCPPVSVSKWFWRWMWPWDELGGVELSWAGSNVPGNFIKNFVGAIKWMMRIEDVQLLHFFLGCRRGLVVDGLGPKLVESLLLAGRSVSPMLRIAFRETVRLLRWRCL